MTVGRVATTRQNPNAEARTHRHIRPDSRQLRCANGVDVEGCRTDGRPVPWAAPKEFVSHYGSASPKVMWSTMASPALSFRDISMVFPDQTQALSDVTFDVDEGEFVTLVGPSGCGKSTLLRIASGLIEPTSGSVIVDREHLGYVFQDPTLLPWRTVLQNVELLAELDGLDSTERRRRADEAIQLVGLGGFEDHFPKSLSGGMKMRTSLARALTLEPPVFLFDEPFGAVDEITRARLNEETLALFERRRFTGLFITHSIAEAVFMSSRVLVMSARPGRIVDEHMIPFDFPRDPEIRFHPTFAALSGEIGHSLWGAHR